MDDLPYVDPLANLFPANKRVLVRAVPSKQLSLPLRVTDLDRQLSSWLRCAEFEVVKIGPTFFLPAFPVVPGRVRLRLSGGDLILSSLHETKLEMSISENDIVAFRILPSEEP